jgi:serine/threonine protein phosphatase PrpC
MSAHPRPDVGHQTHRGQVRQRNEDNLGLSPPDLSEEVLAAKGRLYLVADGMGGHQEGQRASQIAAQRIVQEYYRDPSPDPQHSLARAIRMANAEIYQEASRAPEIRRMGTTVTAAVLRGTDLLVANVGDSRAYLVRGGATRQLTQDHSLIAEGLRDGTITPDQVSSHPYRGVITRALGAGPDVQPDFFSERLQSGDTLLLCTDGLTNEMDDRQITATIAQSKSVQEAVNRLINQANQYGGRDNVTAVVIGMNGRRPAGAGGLPVWLLPVAGGIGALVLVFVMILVFSNGPQVGTATMMTVTVAEATAPVAVGLLSPLASGTASPEAENLAPSPQEAAKTPLPDGSTPSLTPTPTPSRTATTAPKATATPTTPPSATPGLPYSAPVLLAPDDGAKLTVDRFKLEWQWDRELGENEHFDVRIWREGQEHKSVGWAEGKNQFYSLHIPSLDARLTQPDTKGAYHWAIAVVRGPQDGGIPVKDLSGESRARTFVWSPEASDGPDEEPAPER